MKKQTLLGAVALTTLALAGAANAGELSAAPTANSTVAAPVVIANEVKQTATTSAGVVGLNLTPSKGAILPSGNALLTVSLTGGATFGDAVTAAAVIQGTTCKPTATVSTGGGEDDSSVTFLVSSLNTCNSSEPIEFEIPVLLGDSNNAVNVEAVLKTELGTPIDGGVASTYDAKTKTNLIDFGNSLEVTFTPVAGAATPTATLASKFKSFAGPLKVGDVTIAQDTSLVKGINAATTVGAGDITGAKFTVKGDFSTVDMTVSGKAVTEAVEGSGTGTASITSGIIGTHAVNVAPMTDTPAIKASSYNVSVGLTASSYKTANLAFGPGNVGSVVREGASYLLPWVASGTLAETSTSNTVVRISNIGSAATGPVSVELLTSSNGITTTALVPVAASIAKGGEVVLTSGSLQTALGDFGRADIRVTVEGDAKNLIVRRFVQSTVNGALSEVSLGRSATGQEPQN